MKTLKIILACVGACTVLYGGLKAVAYQRRVLCYHGKCQSIEPGMTLDEVAALYNKKNCEQFLNECHIRLTSHDGKRTMFIVMPDALWSSNTPTVAIALESMTVTAVSCSHL
jgi:hypothetical protein